ncbi:MAG: DUF2975 domain-containing protein [Flavobacteriaceae bacterium]
MAKSILFKTLVDILYILHFIGLIGMLLILPFGRVNINKVNMNVEDLTLFYCFVVIVGILIYIIFLRGLYYLRKTARFLLSNKYFSEQIITNLKKSGNHFLLTGVILLALYAILWIYKLYGGELELVYGTNLLISLFLMIIGMFFIIQSDTLALAKNINEENELTV